MHPRFGHPSTKEAVDKMEAVQRQFTKKIPGLSIHSYDTRLSLLGTETLEARHMKADLVCACKLLFNIVEDDSAKFFRVVDSKVEQEAMSINCVLITVVLM